ncbi:MAG: Asp-tRNA(Asn)/Glu-tRNA(Gln) amidotransferase subunit GatB [Armatimonadetes bacterium]|nr:Asp-tRNA(Asn)/Glu-tRNA(Gln) amidotransferase subunit GatB [Armatimonadota bacterium]
MPSVQHYEPVIGLEVHVELATRTKLFCGCPNQFGAEPNTLVCPVCLGLPGVLPVLNRRAVEMHLLAARAAGCEIPPHSKFDRKNYFYPDMPKNFQTSQYDLPLAVNGCLDIEVEGRRKTIGITRIHLEEDTGKSVHLMETAAGLVPGRLGGSDVTLVDYNRAGVPLLEIVSEPDMATPAEAQAYMIAMRDLLFWLEVSDCKMEEGSLRCDANVSVRPVGQRELGVKTEIKNMNSFKSVRAALEYEIRRQIDVLGQSGSVVQETRLWDENRGLTLSMRSKEHAHDYRYFPEPDLPRLEIGRAWIDQVDAALPELPRARIDRYRDQFGLSDLEVSILTSERGIGEFFETTAGLGASPREVANWIANEISRLCRDRSVELSQSQLTPERLAGLLQLIAAGKLSNRGGREVVEKLFEEGGDAAQWMERLGLAQMSGGDELLAVIRAVLDENPRPVQEYREGVQKALNVLIGQAMKRTKGRANPAEVRRLLQETLSGL